MMSRRASLGRLDLLRIKMLPFFALFQHEALRVFERFEEAFPLDHIARLAAGYQVIHSSRSAPGVGVDMVNGQNHPVCKLMQAIQSAILTLKLVTSEHLHGIFA